MGVLPGSYQSRLFWIFGSAISLFIFIYLIIKAYHMPVTCDESGTFYFYVVPFEINPFTAHADANNHPLNSLLSAIFYRIFGPDKIFIRLASLLAFPVYALYSLKISARLIDEIQKYLLFLALVGTHGVVEFFSVSRGYGMSMSFLLATYFYLNNFMESKRLAHFLLFLLSSFLMLSSNLSLLVVYMISGFIAFFSFFKMYKPLVLKALMLFSWAVPLGFFVGVSFYYKNLGLLYYGSLDGFWQVTVKSLVWLIFGKFHLAAGVVAAIFGLVVLVKYFSDFKNGKIFQFIEDKDIAASHLFLGNLMVVLILGYLMKVNFPEDRVGMHLYILLLIAVFQVINGLQNRFLRYLKWALVSVLVLPFHFLTSANLDYTQCYKDYYYPDSFYEAIAENKENETPLIGIYRTWALEWQYQNMLAGGSMPYVFWSNYPDTISDFLIANPDDHEFYKTGYEVLKVDEVNGRCVLKRKNPLKRRLIYDVGDSLFTGKTNIEYIPIWELLSDSLNNYNLLFEVDFTISSDSLVNDAWIVASANDSLGNVTQYEYIPVFRSKPYFNEANFKSVMVFYKTAPETTRKVCYFWNTKKRFVNVQRNRLKVYSFE